MDHILQSTASHTAFRTFLAHGPRPQPGMHSNATAILQEIDLERWTTLVPWLQKWTLDSLRRHEVKYPPDATNNWCSKQVQEWGKMADRIIIVLAWAERQVWAINQRLPWGGLPADPLTEAKPPLYTIYDCKDLPLAFPFLPLSCLYTWDHLEQAINAIKYLLQHQGIGRSWALGVPGSRKYLLEMWNESSESACQQQRRICRNLWNLFTQCFLFGGMPDGYPPAASFAFRSTIPVPAFGAALELTTTQYEAPRFVGHHQAPYPCTRTLDELNVDVLHAALDAICHKASPFHNPQIHARVDSWAISVMQTLNERHGSFMMLDDVEATALLLELEAIYCQLPSWHGHLPFPSLVLECIAKKPLEEATLRYHVQKGAANNLEQYGWQLRPSVSASETQSTPYYLPLHHSPTLPMPPHDAGVYSHNPGPATVHPHAAQIPRDLAAPPTSLPIFSSQHAFPPSRWSGEPQHLQYSQPRSGPSGQYESLARVKRRLGRGRAESSGRAWEF